MTTRPLFGSTARICRPAVLLLSLLGLSAQAQAQNLLVNGGFESADLSGWSLSGNTAFSGVQCSGPSLTVAEGVCAVFMGATGAEGMLQQTFSTLTGGNYILQFAALFDGSAPTSFTASINGARVVALPNAFTSIYQTFSVPFTAAAAQSSISFSFRNDQAFSFLDAVVVTAAPVPEPSPAWLLGLGLVGVGLRRWRRN